MSVRKTVSALLLVSMLLPLVACNKEVDYYPDVISEDTVWYNTETIEMGEAYTQEQRNSGKFFYLGTIDGEYYYAECLYDYVNDEQISNIKAYNRNGDVVKTYDITQMRSENPVFFFARVVDGEIILRYYDGDVLVDRNRSECVQINNTNYRNSAGYIDHPLDFAGSDTVDDLRFDAYMKQGIRTNSLVFEVYDGDELVKTVDMEDYLPETDLFGSEHFLKIDTYKYLLIRSKDYNQGFYEWDLDNDTVTDVTGDYDWLDQLRSARYRTCTSGNFAIDESGIYKIDLANRTYTKYATTLNFDIPVIDYDTVIADVTDDQIFLEPGTGFSSRSVANKKYYILTKSDSNPNSGKQVIKIASTGGISSGLYDLITEYNKTHDNYYVLVDDRYYIKNFYGKFVNAADTTSTFWTEADAAVNDKLLVDMKAEDGPDILMDGAGIIAFERDDCLLDCNQFIDGANGINRDEYFDNVFRAYESGGKLYNVPLFYTIDMIATVSDSIRDDQIGFTFEEYGRFVQSELDSKDIVLNGSRGKKNFALMLLNGCLGDLINEGRIDFGSDEFTSIATYAHDNVLKARTDSEWMDKTANRWFIANLHDLLDYCGYAGWDIEDVHMLGTPAVEERSPLLCHGASASITKSASDPAGCWEFIKYLLSENAQMMLNNGDAETNSRGGLNLVNRNAFDESCRKQIDNYNEECIANRNSNRQMSEADLRLSGIPCIQADESVIDLYRDVIESLDRHSSTDPNIELIFGEEIDAYFYDNKTLEECIEIMNNRAQIVLDERR